MMSSGVEDMSLDSLYKHILLSEQQAAENSRQLYEVKSAIIKTEEEIKSSTEKLKHAHAELDETAQLESKMMLQLNLVKRQQQDMEKKKEELLEQQAGLRQEMERINREAAEEKEKFMNTIRSFNSEYNLLRNRGDLFESQTRSQIQSLEMEAEALTKEIEKMKQEDPRLISLQTERESLAAELQGLESHLAGLDMELDEAAALTESLKNERETVIQKPLTDSTFIRLRKELEAHKEMEIKHEALIREIHSLRSK